MNSSQTRVERRTAVFITQEVCLYFILRGEVLLLGGKYSRNFALPARRTTRSKKEESPQVQCVGMALESTVATRKASLRCTTCMWCHHVARASSRSRGVVRQRSPPSLASSSPLPRHLCMHLSHVPHAHSAAAGSLARLIVELEMFVRS